MRDIPGYEGLYAATSCGKIWSYRRKRFLKLDGFRGNYIMVTLRDKDGKDKSHYVHRLIAMTYIPNPDNLPQVNHKDETRDNNCVNNLEWCTSGYNLAYSHIQQKRRFIPIYCVELDRTFKSAYEAARELGLYPNNIRDCCAGMFERTGGLHFRYAE